MATRFYVILVNMTTEMFAEKMRVLMPLFATNTKNDRMKEI